MTSPHRSPAQMFALVFGIVLVAAGVLGFIVNSSFEVGSSLERDELIIFAVNGWHNVVHIATGAIGLAVFASPAASRIYAFVYGAIYVVVTVWGFIDGSDVAELIPINTADNFLHVAIAVAGIAAGLASPPPGEVKQRAATA